MTYKVIQWSTGNVGRHAVRLIAEHPDLELVGLWVHSEDKAGRDAGEIVGIDPIGVTATNDVDALLALDADCVCYTATADLRPAEAIADMARIAMSGKNIVSSSVVPLVYPAARRARDARGRSKTRATKRGVSCFTSGIDPGWANDLLAARAHRSVRVHRHGARDGGRQLRDVRAADGAVRHDGLRPGARRDAVAPHPRRALVRVGRHGEGDRGRARCRDRRAARGARAPARDGDASTSASAWSEKGTTAAMRFEVQGIVDGEPRIILEHVTRLDDALAPDWPQPAGHSGYRVIVTGNPTYTCDVQMMGDDGDHNTGGPRRHRGPPGQHDPRGVRGRSRPALGARPAAGPRTRAAAPAVSR